MNDKLDKDEQELLQSIEKGEWNSIDNIESQKSFYQEVAKNTIKKDKRINIRISSRDLNLLQRKAIEEGLPYQTLISSILHKFANSN